MKLILLLPVLAILPNAAWASSIIDLGSLGGATSMAYSVNDHGQTAGSADTIFGNTQAMSGGGPLAMSAGAYDSSAWSVNNAGQISGAQLIGGESYATVWNSGTPQLIAAAGSYGLGMNQSGDVAGMFTTSTGQGEAFERINGILTPLGIASGQIWSAAYGINNSDEAAGYALSNGAMQAFLWSSQSGYMTLGTLGGANTYALAINDSGQAAGHAQTAAGYMHATLWTNGAAQDLGTLNGGNSHAYGLNNAGEVVGDSAGHAFLYQDGVMLDLNSMVDPASGWTLTAAYAINALGEIAGAGLFNGTEHAFLLDPAPSTFSTSAAVPEPATWSLVLLSLVVFAFIRVHLWPN
jgi:probable HAF family extracellular repeat protein